MPLKQSDRDLLGSIASGSLIWLRLEDGSAIEGCVQDVADGCLRLEDRQEVSFDRIEEIHFIVRAEGPE